MPSVLVIGGAGYIGSYITNRLIDDGYSVRIADLKPSESVRSSLKRFDLINYKEGSLVDLDYTNDICKDMDYILHLAYIPFDYRKESTDIFYDRNINGIINLLSSTLLNKCRRLVFSSSCAVYGNNDRCPISENHPINPSSCYGASKVAAEYYISSFSKSEEIDACSLRYFSVYGQGIDLDSNKSAFLPTGVPMLLPLIISKIRSNEPIELSNNGESTRDFINIEDIYRANLCAILSEKQLKGKSINIGTGIETKVIDFVKLAYKSFNKELNLKHEKYSNTSSLTRFCADITLASELLKFSPSVFLTDWFIDFSKKIKEIE